MLSSREQDDRSLPKAERAVSLPMRIRRRAVAIAAAVCVVACGGASSSYPPRPACRGAVSPAACSLDCKRWGQGCRYANFSAESTFCNALGNCIESNCKGVASGAPKTASCEACGSVRDSVECEQWGRHANSFCDAVSRDCEELCAGVNRPDNLWRRLGEGHFSGAYLQPGPASR
jgi:hypothetical protein